MLDHCERCGISWLRDFRIGTDLESKDLWLCEGERFAVDLDEAFSLLLNLLSESCGEEQYTLSIVEYFVPCSVRLRLLLVVSPNSQTFDVDYAYQSSSCRSTVHSERKPCWVECRLTVGRS